MKPTLPTFASPLVQESPAYRSRRMAAAWLQRLQLPLFLLVLLITITLAGFTLNHVWNYPYFGTYWSWRTGVVDEVQAGSPAELIGIETGDQILTVDGRPVAGGMQLSRPGTGETLTISWLRGTERFSAALPGRSYPASVLFWQLEPLLVAAFLGLVGTIILALRPALPVVRMYFLVSHATASVLCGGLLSAFGHPLGVRLFGAALAWLAPLVIHFHLFFLNEPSGPRLRWLLRGSYLAAALLTWAFLLAPESFLAIPNVDLLLSGGVRALVVLSLVTSGSLLYHVHRRSETFLVRRRIRVLGFGTLFAALPLLVFSLLPDLLGRGPILPYQFTFLFLLLIPLAYGWAVWRHNLFDTDRVLNRRVVNALLAFGWAGAYLLLVNLLTFWFPLTTGVYLSTGMVLTVVGAVAMPTLQRMTDVALGRLFSQGFYEPREVQDTFSRALSATLEWETIRQLLVERLPQTLHARSSLLFHIDPEQPRLWASHPELAEQIAPLSSDGVIARGLARLHRPLTHDAARQQLRGAALSVAEAALLDRTDIGIWVPLLFEGTPVALLLLGHRRADEPYTAEDLHLLTLLARHAATSVQNARLVERLQTQLAAVVVSRTELSQAHRRLLQAREEERKSLAREVHDGPIQDVIGISFQLRSYSRQAASSDLTQPLSTLRTDTLRVLNDLRDICTQMRPPDLDVLGLAAAITSHAKSRPELVALVDLALWEERVVLPNSVAISLFRIYQEAVQNAIKHAGATRIVVGLERLNGGCVLTIEDDGCGFKPPARLESLAVAHHFGLIGISERAQAINATLDLDAVPQQGTRLRVTVPLAAAARPVVPVSMEEL